jgi:hypothetical protein
VPGAGRPGCQEQLLDTTRSISLFATLSRARVKAKAEHGALPRPARPRDDRGIATS